MDEETKKRIEEIMGDMQCPNGLRCANGGLEQLCKARDFGLEHYLDCLEENPLECKFALRFGYGHLCRCPARIYIARELGK